MSSRLSSLLVQDGLVSAKRVADALQRQVIHGGTLDSNLLEIKALDEDVLIAYLGRACGLPTQPTGIAESGPPLPAVLELFTDEVAQRYNAVPTTLLSGGVLQVLVKEEVEISAMDALALAVKQRIEPWVVLEFRFAEALERVYGRSMPTRFSRLLQRSIQTHQGKSWPAPRLIDPIPRFGGYSEVRLPGPPPPAAASPAVTARAPAVSVPPPAAEPAAVKEAPAKPPAPVAESAAVKEAPAKPPAPVAEPAAVKEAPAKPPAPAAKEEPPAVVKTAPAAAPAPPPAFAAVAVHVEPQAPAVEAPIAASVTVPPPVVVLETPAALEPQPTHSRLAAAVTPTPAPAAVVPPEAAPATPAGSTAASVSAAKLVEESPQGASASSPSRSGIEEISLDDWMSAADWMSVANKLPPAEAPGASATPQPAAEPQPPASAQPAVAASPAPSPAAKAAIDKPEPLAAPVASEKVVPAAATALAESSAEKTVRTQVPPAEAASSATPSKRKGKRKGSKEPATNIVKPAAVETPPSQLPAATPVSVPAKPAVPSLGTPASKPTLPASISRPPSKPTLPAIASAASSKPGLPSTISAPSSKPVVPTTVSRPPPAPSLPSTVSAPSDLAELPAQNANAQKLNVPAPPASTKEATPAPQPPSSEAIVRDAIPEPIDSGRLGERIQKQAPVALEPALRTARVAAPQAVQPEAAAPQAAEVSAPRETSAAAPAETVALARSSSGPVAIPPSAASPTMDAESAETELRPPPRVAVALDETGASPLSLEAARELVSLANDRDAIFEAVCRGMRSRAAFAAAFTIHGDVAFGRVALSETWLDRQTVGRVSVQLDRASAFRVVAKGRAPFVGLVGEQPVASDPLRALERRPPLPAAVLPILLRGRPVALLYLDDDGRELPATLTEELQPLISEVGQGFHRLLQLAKVGGLGAAEGDAAAPQEVQEAGTSALRPRASRVDEPPAAVPAAPELAAPEAAPVPAPAPAPDSVPPAAEAVPVAPLSALPTVPISKTGPVAATAPATRSSGRAGRAAGRSQKSPPASAASPPAVAASKPAIATTDLTALLDRAAASPRDLAPLREILAIGQPAVQPLIDRLKDATTPPRLCHAIVRCLAEMPVQAAIEPLGERLFDKEEEVRTAAAAALRNFPQSSALSVLRTRLRDALDGSDAKGVQQAAEALGELRDTQAVPQLIALLEHRDPLLVDAVGRALQSITKQDFGRSRSRWSDWWRRHQEEPRLQWLLAGLCHPSAIIRSTAQDELVEMSGDVASYRYDLPRRERDEAARRWVGWWQTHGYDVI